MLGHLGGTRDAVDLAHVVQLRTEAAVRAEYDVANDRGHRHAVERPVEAPPQSAARLQPVPGPAFVVESVPEIYGTALVVAAQQVHVLREPSLEHQQHGDHLRHARMITKSRTGSKSNNTK